MAYAGAGGATLVHRRLFPAEAWTGDEAHAERRQRCGVPEEALAFRTKPQLAPGCWPTVVPRTRPRLVPGAPALTGICAAPDMGDRRRTPAVRTAGVRRAVATLRVPRPRAVRPGGLCWRCAGLPAGCVTTGPGRGRSHGARLAGDRLVDGVYRPIDIEWSKQS